MAEIAAVILAAGRGSRFGADAEASKLTALLDGKPLVRLVAEAALASRAAPVVIVLGHAASAVRDCVADLPVTTIFNAQYATGLASSLKTGVAALPPDAAGVLVLLGDMPRVTPFVLDRLIEAFKAQRDPPDAVLPTYNGRDGNPVLLGRTLFGAVQGLAGDEGAQRLWAMRGRRVVRCAMEEPGVAVDVDTPEALRALQAEP